MSNWKNMYNKWNEAEGLDVELQQELLTLSESEKEDAFYCNLEFGTAGMRGIIGVGTNRMNVYTIRKANTGFAKYISQNGEDACKRGIVIAYDSRHKSPEFAQESAKVMASYGIKTYLFEDICSTPELSFAVRELNAFAGIVITASHNPPNYNGYKIYDETGCQCIPEVASKIVKLVNAVENELAITVDSLENYLKQGLIELIGEKIDAAYNEAVCATSFADVPKTEIKLVYTSLHGTGHIPVLRALQTLRYKNVFPVDAQCTPDPNFTTVPLPNPEDPNVFALAKQVAKQVDADILLATDPDADRLGIAVKADNGEYQLLNGNITGGLMTYYILERLKDMDKLPANGVLFTTIVTSDFAEKIAASFNITTERTLTGFKFIGDRIKHYESTKEKQFLFGFEESYGSLTNATIARDKDAVQACVILVEMAAFYKKQGRTLLDVLAELSTKFGTFEEGLVNISLAGITGAKKIKKLITTISNSPFTTMNGQEVVTFENYIASTRITANEETKITLPKADVLKFYLADGSWFCVRPSGTEPKAKIYIAVCEKAKPIAEAKVEALKNAIMVEINKIIAD